MRYDITSGCYVGFAVLNMMVFTGVLGFFSGTGQMHSGIEPCIHELANQGFGHRGKEQDLRMDLQREELDKCLEKLQEYVFANSSAHWVRVLIPFMFVAILNSVVFLFLWTMRSVFQMRVQMRSLCFGKIDQGGPMEMHGDGFGEGEMVGACNPEEIEPQNWQNHGNTEGEDL